MNNQDLIGKKVRGFKFKTGDCLLYGYGDSMDKYIGVEGEIWTVNEKEKAVFIKFKDDGYYYPLDQIQAHLVDETKEEPDQIEKFENALKEGIKNSKLNEDCKSNEPLDKGFFALAVGNTIEDKIEQLAKELYVLECAYNIDNDLESKAINSIRAAKAFYNQLNQN